MGWIKFQEKVPEDNQIIQVIAIRLVKCEGIWQDEKFVVCDSRDIPQYTNPLKWRPKSEEKAKGSLLLQFPWIQIDELD